MDAHSPDPAHPLRQNTRPADPVSKVYRTNEFFPAEKVDLSKQPNFDATKRKLLWMQNGGEKGIEIDDVVVLPTP
ncbi:MAG: hypothetical protein RLZZ253_2769 [Verrucomicrobiota bacterium]